MNIVDLSRFDKTWTPGLSKTVAPGEIEGGSRQAQLGQLVQAPRLATLGSHGHCLTCCSVFCLVSVSTGFLIC